MPSTPSLTIDSTLPTFRSENASRINSTSPGSSSTSSTEISSAFISSTPCQVPPHNWKGKPKASTVGVAGVKPHMPAVELDDLAAQGEPDATSVIRVARVQPLEDQEDPPGVVPP